MNEKLEALNQEREKTEKKLHQLQETFLELNMTIKMPS